MKKKIGTVVDEAIFRRLRVHAARQGRAVSDVIQESISSYLAVHEGSMDERIRAFEKFISKPFALTSAQLDTVLEENPLDQ
jgi:hypothetical protein